MRLRGSCPPQAFRLNTLAVAVFTNTLPPPSLKSEMPKVAPTAVFLIYGEKGQNGSETKPNMLFYAAARAPKQIWEVRQFARGIDFLETYSANGKDISSRTPPASTSTSRPIRSLGPATSVTSPSRVAESSTRRQDAS
jgi:hypothetical protein